MFTVSMPGIDLLSKLMASDTATLAEFDALRLAAGVTREGWKFKFKLEFDLGTSSVWEFVLVRA